MLIIAPRIRAIAVLSASCLLATACTSSPDYQAASRDGASGYSDSAIQKNRYLVNFTGDTTTSRAEVKSYALLRAAELTMEKGYDWFEVVSRDTITEQERRTPTNTVRNDQVYVRDCGLLSCRTSVHDRPNVALSVDGGTRTEYATSLEIVMHQGSAPSANKQAYDASEVAANLRSRLDVASS